MKKIMLLAGMAAMMATTVVTFDSCRKGAEDPAISLRSRKARLVGEWKLTEGNDTSTNGSFTSYTAYTETTETVSTGSGSAMSNPYEEKMTFNADGTFEIYEKTTNASSGSYDVMTTTGTWDFNSGVGEETKMAKVILTPTNVEEVSTSGSSITTTNYAYVNNALVFTIDLVRLSNKELKVYSIDNSVSTGTSTSSSTSVSHKTYSAL